MENTDALFSLAHWLDEHNIKAKVIDGKAVISVDMSGFTAKDAIYYAVFEEMLKRVGLDPQQA